MKNVSPVKALVVGGILQAVGLIICFVGYIAKSALALLGIALIIGGLVFMQLYYRCPHCGKILASSNRRKMHMPGFCPHCGMQYTGFAEHPEQKPEEVDYEPWRKFK